MGCGGSKNDVLKVDPKVKKWIKKHRRNMSKKDKAFQKQAMKNYERRTNLKNIILKASNAKTRGSFNSFKSIDSLIMSDDAMSNSRSSSRWK
jgi:L-lactate utilization protein LutB